MGRLDIYTNMATSTLIRDIKFLLTFILVFNLSFPSCSGDEAQLPDLAEVQQWSKQFSENIINKNHVLSIFKVTYKKKSLSGNFPNKGLSFDQANLDLPGMVETMS